MNIEHSWSDKGSAVRTRIDEWESIKHVKNLLLIKTPLDDVTTTSDHRDTNINIFRTTFEYLIPIKIEMFYCITMHLK